MKMSESEIPVGLRARVVGVEFKGGSDKLTIGDFLTHLASNQGVVDGGDTTSGSATIVCKKLDGNDYAGVVITNVKSKTRWHLEIDDDGNQKLKIQEAQASELVVELNFFVLRKTSDTYCGLFQSKPLSASSFMALMTKLYTARKRELWDAEIGALSSFNLEGGILDKKKREIGAEYKAGLKAAFICNNESFEEVFRDAVGTKHVSMVVRPEQVAELSASAAVSDVLSKARRPFRIEVSLSPEDGLKEKVLHLLKSVFPWTGKNRRERHYVDLAMADGAERGMYIDLNRTGFPDVNAEDVMSKDLLSESKNADGSSEFVFEYEKLKEHRVVAMLRSYMNSEEYGLIFS